VVVERWCSYRSEEQRKEWGLKPGDVVVLFASRLVWEKNVRVYIDTVNTLLKQKLPIRPVVVGAGPALVCNLHVQAPYTICPATNVQFRCNWRREAFFSSARALALQSKRNPCLLQMSNATWYCLHFHFLRFREV
jgi:glycosyltransferase involved in cell wall biosynthesis